MVGCWGNDHLLGSAINITNNISEDIWGNPEIQTGILTFHGQQKRHKGKFVGTRKYK